MSALTFANMCLAKTPEERAEAERLHREDVKNRPTDAEIITEFLSNCHTSQGSAVLGRGEYAEFNNGKVTVKKLN